METKRKAVDSGERGEYETRPASLRLVLLGVETTSHGEGFTPVQSQSQVGSHALPARFWNKVEITETCWLWTGARTRSGYGNILFEGRYVYAHRLAYEALKGPIPDGLHIDHLCRTTNCVNPDHLEPVTPRENQRRGLQGVLLTHCPQGHEYNEANTYLWHGRRHCRVCNTARHAERASKAINRVPVGSTQQLSIPASATRSVVALEHAGSEEVVRLGK